MTTTTYHCSECGNQVEEYCEEHPSAEIASVRDVEALKAAVIEEAKKDAQLFVDEWNEPLDPETTDWDATAWADVQVKLHFNGSFENLWELYQSTLVAETERLCQ